MAKLSWSSVRLCQTVKQLIAASRQMLFLDEPTAAVDAGAKRHLWKVWPGAAGPGVCSHSVLQPTLKLPKPSSKLEPLSAELFSPQVINKRASDQRLVRSRPFLAVGC